MYCNCSAVALALASRVESNFGLAPNRRAGQILILGFYLDNFRDKNRRKIVKTGARKEKTAQKSKSKSRAGFILILGSKWRRFGGRPNFLPEDTNIYKQKTSITKYTFREKKYTPRHNIQQNIVNH